MSFIIWNPAGGCPTRKHDTYEIAEKEAMRLIDTNPKGEFYICELVTRVKAETRVIKDYLRATEQVVDRSPVVCLAGVAQGTICHRRNGSLCVVVDAFGSDYMCHDRNTVARDGRCHRGSSLDIVRITNQKVPAYAHELYHLYICDARPNCYSFHYSPSLGGSWVAKDYVCSESIGPNDFYLVKK
jgi:hypothetical protein